MSRSDYSPGGKIFGWLYRLAVGLALFTGFGQMPIFKRYYIADLPLMGWSAKFFVTSDIHYLMAALLIFLLVWRLSLGGGLLDRRWSWGPRTWFGWALLGLLVASGGAKALRNAGVFIDPFWLMMLDFTHLGSAMTFIIAGLVGVSRGRPDPAAETA